ncbi:MAG TPA: DUF2911 domain-containing protein [Bryobacteraceae bacterium]|nr:DUF2911 domain-containing protein [Bryobacteraceae bacterium]
MKPAAIGSILTLALAGSACAQKYTSPPAEATTTINGKTITIKYSAPSLHGRKMLGGNDPYGKVWRTGANSATALHTDGTLKIGDLTVPPGDYTIYSLPEPGALTLIINKQTGQWGTEYNESQDLGRVKMNVKRPGSMIETLKISLDNDGGNKGTLRIAWQDIDASIPFTVE